MRCNLLQAYPTWWHSLDLPINRPEAQHFIAKCKGAITVDIPAEQRPKLEHIKITVDIDADLCDVDLLRELRSKTLRELTTAYERCLRHIQGGRTHHEIRKPPL